MKFCETFGMNPMEYDELPRSLVDEWLLMKNLESQWQMQQKN